MLANLFFFLKSIWQYRLPVATSTPRKQIFIALSFTTYLLLPLASSRWQLLLSRHKAVGLINCTPYSREIKRSTGCNRMRRLHEPTWEMINTTVWWCETLSIISQSFDKHSQRHYSFISSSSSRSLLAEIVETSRFQPHFKFLSNFAVSLS